MTSSGAARTVRWHGARWLALVAVLLGAWCVAYTNWDMLAGSGGPSLEGVDDTGYYIWLRSGVIDRDFDFANDLRDAPTLRKEVQELWLSAPRTEIGRVANKYPPGWALVTLPAFLVGHFVAFASGSPPDGWSAPYFVAIWAYHLLLAAGGLWCAWKVVARFAPSDLAAIAVLALWIASPLIYYQTGRVGMVHGLLFSLIAAIHFLVFAIRDEPSVIWRWPIVGLLCGLVGLVRMPAVAYLLFPAIVLVRQLTQLRGPARTAAITSLLGPVLAAVVVIAGVNWTLHGSVWAVPYPGESFNFSRPRFFAVLFSPLHGLFYWHPLILVGLLGLLWAAVRREVPRSWLVGIAVMLYVNATWHNWWFGSSFGHRAFEGTIFFAMAGLAWLFARVENVKRWGRLCASVTAAGVLAGAVLLVLFVTREIPREAPVTYFDMCAAVMRGVERMLDPGAVE